MLYHSSTEVITHPDHPATDTQFDTDSANDADGLASVIVTLGGTGLVRIGIDADAVIEAAPDTNAA